MEVTNCDLQKYKNRLALCPVLFYGTGGTMLSCVLNSERAINVNIRIIRAFTSMRETLTEHKNVLEEIVRIWKMVNGHDEKIRTIFDYIKQLSSQPAIARRSIGYEKSKE